MKNAFNMKIPEIREILEIQNVRKYITETLESILETLRINDKQKINSDLLELSCERLDAYEQKAHEILEQAGVTEKIQDHLSDRAEKIYDQIKPFLVGNTALDLGCGDGKIGTILAKKGFQTTLADVYKNPNVEKTGLEFIDLNQGQDVPLQKQYDNVLLLTVMHHSDDPIKTLREAKRLSRERIIIIESVDGISPNIEETFDYGIQSKKESQRFKLLNQEEQRLVNIFFDHFYNRVLHYSSNIESKVNVPFNFNTPKEWSRIFRENQLTQLAVQYLGVDQPIVPEYHTLHILEVKQ